MIEIRIHGRGGQGGVTLAKILAAAHHREGKSVQAFGIYAAERSGAPLAAFLRYDDEPFDYLRHKILNCGALVMGTPVYWWDTSGLIKYLTLKMFRVYALSGPLKGLPALGLSIAGGTGNGLVSGLRPVYHFFQMMRMRALEPVPATRFNLNQSLKRAGELGEQIAGMANERIPFRGLEEQLVVYDNLPYLGLSRAEERCLLADIIAMAVPEEMGHEVLSGLARADALEASGRIVEAQSEITRVYEAGVKAFDKK